MLETCSWASPRISPRGQPVPPFSARIPAVQLEAFNAGVGTLFGGAALFVELSGAPSAPQLLDLRGPGASALPVDVPVRLAILRP